MSVARTCSNVPAASAARCPAAAVVVPAGSRPALLSSIRLPAVTVERVFTVVFVLMPLLDVIVSPVPGIESSVLFGLPVLYTLVALRLRSASRLGAWCPFFLFLACTSIAQIAFGDAVVSGGVPYLCLRLGKLLLFLVPLLCLSLNRLVDRDLAFATMRLVCVVSAVWVFVQWAANHMGVFVFNLLSPLSSESLYLPANYWYGDYLWRPSGLFMEPSHMAQYALPFLTWQLFDPERTRGRLPVAAVVSLAIVMTGSGMGLAGVAGLLALFVIVSLPRDARYVIALAVIAAAFVVAAQMGYVHKVLARIFTDSAATGGNAFEGRIGPGYEELLAKGPVEVLFGSGFGNIATSEYMSGLEFALNSVGVLGTLVFIVCIICVLTGCAGWGKLVGLLYLGMLVISQVFSVASLCLYFLLVECSRREGTLREWEDVRAGS